MSGFRIYGLSDPLEPEKLRYVGQTKYTVPQRVKSHMSLCANFSGPADGLLLAMQLSGRVPVVSLLGDYTEHWVYGTQLEQKFIEHYSPSCDLFNKEVWASRQCALGVPRQVLGAYSSAFWSAAQAMTRCRDLAGGMPVARNKAKFWWPIARTWSVIQAIELAYPSLSIARDTLTKDKWVKYTALRWLNSRKTITMAQLRPVAVPPFHVPEIPCEPSKPVLRRRSRKAAEC